MLDALAAALADTGSEGWLVGGCLRDALLGVPVGDIDVALACEPLPVAERLAKRKRLAVARLGRGTIRLTSRRTPRTYLDLTPLQGDDIAVDLARRDFTINAMALPLAARAEWLAVVRSQSATMPSLLDPFGGREDLLERRLRVVGSSVFRDDPGRILRAARWRARFGLRSDDETLLLARETAPLLVALSADRLREEMTLLLALPGATDGIAMLADVSALAVIIPGLSEENTRYALATLRQLDVLMGISDDGTGYPAMQSWSADATRRVALRQSALHHTAGAHENVSANRTASLWQRALVALSVDDDAQRLYGARLYFAQAGRDEAAAVDALMVATACILARGEQQRGQHLAMRADAIISSYQHNRELLIPPPLLSGKELMVTLELPSGQMIGQLLQAVRRAQLAGEIADHNEALAFARRLSNT